MRVIWLIFGLIVLGLGCLGVVLPLLPTVPFILLAAFCFAKSSNKLHNWLLTHRLFGKMIQDWRQSGAISTSAKKNGHIIDCFGFCNFCDHRCETANINNTSSRLKLRFIVYLDSTCCVELKIRHRSSN